jgi:hypothetical protein
MDTKIGVVLYHKNILDIYYSQWVRRSVESILNQKGCSFKIYEVNYGGEEHSVFPPEKGEIELDFYSMNFENHAQAMNFIIDKAFEDGCDFVFNTNLDDYYSLDRIQKQMKFLIQGFDLVSSDLCYIQGDGNHDTVLKYMALSDGDIQSHFNKNHNVVAHPSVAYSRRFWSSNRYIDSEIPEEDFSLWKRSLSNGFSIKIVPEYLLFYRLHSSQVTGNNEEVAKELWKSKSRVNIPLPPNPTSIR